MHDGCCLNGKPTLKAWLQMVLIFALALFSRMNQMLFAGPPDKYSQPFPQPDFSNNYNLGGRQVQAKETRSVPGSIPTPRASLDETLLHLPPTSPPPAQGGVVLFQHVVKTGGTTIRNNFKNKTKFPNIDYKEVLARKYWTKIQAAVDRRVSEPLQRDLKTILFIELHGRNTPTMVELAPIIQEWKQKAKINSVPFYAFTLLRDPVELAISFFNQFHVFGDKRFGPNMPGTVLHLRKTLQRNPQCLYLCQGEQAYFMPHKFYNVTRKDCQQIEALLRDVMEWVGDTKNLSDDTLPLLTYWLTGQASLAVQLESSNVAETKRQKYRPLPMQEVDEDTIGLIRLRSVLDQSLYQNSITTNKLKELVVGTKKEPTLE